MKATGIVRKMDHLGRVVIPVEIRRTMKISTGDPVEFFVDGDGIIVRKYDTNGDMVQLLENVERSIQITDPYISPAKKQKILDKVREMKDIVTEAQK